MSRAATVGNGNVLVGLDYHGQVRDFYFPFVGHSNHVSGASGTFVHRVGIYVDERLAWLDDSGWRINIKCDPNTVVSSLHAVHDELGVTLTSTDLVHNEENIFLRSFVIGNEQKESREIKLFLAQQFRISESRRGDTGFFDPRVNAIVHYKGNTTFLINAFADETQFTDYSIGLFDIEGRAGTFLDAEDGVLERNPIEHGSVDSIMGLTFTMQPESYEHAHYWIACGTNIDEAHDLNRHVLKETPEALIRSTENYWTAWLNKEDRDLSFLSPELLSLYNQSLTTIRVHTDNRGAIIASSDTEMLHHGRDTYSYVWPRDASIIAHALSTTGYRDVSKRYFEFMTKRIERGGYLMHKYRSDGVLGSSWHPWMHDGVAHLPIQEDETALTLFMLWQYYLDTKNIEFIESVYNTFVEPAAEFMADYIEPVTGLPEASYDLWEEKYGSSTYTASAVYGALLSATQCAQLLGKDEPARRYLAIAQRMQSSIRDHLYDDELGMFVKLVWMNTDDELEYDRTVDISSFFGPLYFGVIEPDDPRVARAKEVVDERLQVHAESAGYVRYEGDNYYKMQSADSPNPWVIATLWMAQYYIMVATSEADLKAAYEILEWTCSHSTKSGVLDEQMNPQTREHLSTAPLIWSHAEYVLTVEAYKQKLAALRG